MIKISSSVSTWSTGRSVFLVIFLSVLCFTLSGASTPSTIMNPKDHPRECGRPEGITHSSVCDPFNVLTTENANIIEGRINGIKQAEMAVLLIKKMDSSYISFRGKDKAAENFARTIHDTWQVGSNSKNDGILIFVSVEDRALYISTGSGVDTVLTPLTLESVIDHMKPFLQSGNYFGALDFAVVEMSLLLSGERPPTAAPGTGYEGTIFMAIVLLFGGFFGIKAYYDNAKKEELTKGSGKLKSLMREISSLGDEKFKSRSCPICLEDFPPEPIKQDPPITEADSPLLPKELNRPMALKCGHVFCFTCLDEHLKSANGSRCPICRKNVDGSDSATEGHTPRAPCSPTQGAESIRNTELLYRVGRMRHLYPAVMTSQTQQRMEDSINSGDMDRLRVIADERVADVQTILADIAQRQAAARSGASGSSSSSFGGGRSSGGRGGSW